MIAKFKPRNDLLLVEKVKIEQKNESGIIIPNDTRSTVLTCFKVLAVGPLVTDLKENDIVWGEDLIEPIYKSNMETGLINQKYIHCIEYGQPIN